MLVNFPFKGDEGALRGMEQAELIAITAHDGTPRPTLRLSLSLPYSVCLAHAVCRARA